MLSTGEVRNLDDVKRLERTDFADQGAALTIYDMLKRAAEKSGDRPALSFLATGEVGETARTWTHSEFFSKLTQVTRAVSAEGLEREDTVSLLLPPLPETHLVLWGSAAVAQTLPINFLLQPGHVTELVRSANVKLLFAPKPLPGLDLSATIEAVKEGAPGTKIIELDFTNPTGDAFTQWYSAQSSEPLAGEQLPQPSQVAALFHTGGTTGAPKLAQLTHKQISAAAFGFAELYALTPDDMVINGLPLFHVGGSLDLGLGALARGAGNLIPTPTTFRNPKVMQNHWQIAVDHGATITSGTPTTLGAWLAAPGETPDTGKLDLCISGGAVLPKAIAEGFEDRFGIKVSQTYGMTEASGLIAAGPRRGTIPGHVAGLRAPYLEIRASIPGPDGQPTTDCSAGREGLLLVRGPNVFSGYVDPAHNKGVVLEGGWLNTGDLGKVSSSGVVEITGRAKDAIIRSGHNIDPGIIEDALLTHGAVEAAAAVGEPDAYAGEIPVAYVQLKPGAEASEADLAKHVRPLISERPAIPKSIRILPVLPLTAVGKVFKPELRDDAAINAVQRVANENAGPFSPKVAFNSSSETKAATITLTSASPEDHALLRAAIDKLILPFSVEILKA